MYDLDNFLMRYSAIRAGAIHGGSEGSTPTELEIRFKKVTHADFMKIVELLLNDGYTPTVTKSIVSILRVEDKNRESVLREIVIGKDGKSEAYRRKTNVLAPIHDTSKIVEFKMSCCTEEEIGPCDMSKCSLIRVKIRVSLRGKEESPWRYDLTIMKQMDPRSVDSLKNVVRTMFSKRIDADNVLQSLNEFLRGHEQLYNYEIEAEYVGDQAPKSAEVHDTINKIVGGINPEYMEEALFREYIIKVADSVGYQRSLRRYTLKEILPQALSMSRKDYEDIFPPIGWTITEKLDGKRAAVVCSNSTIYIVSDQLQKVGKVDNVADFVAEGELVDDTVYLFDVMMFNNAIVYNYGFTTRLTYIPRIVDAVKLPQITTKDFVTLGDNLKADFEKLEKASLGLPTDGIVFIQDNKDYASTRTYKWKPLEATTIDFLVRKYPWPFANVAPIEGHDLYFLFVGINVNLFSTSSMKQCQNYGKLFDGFHGKPYFPIQFSPSSCPNAFVYMHPKDGVDIDSKIVEFKIADDSLEEPCTPRGPKWEICRIREDRTRDYEANNYFGNDFRIAELTWNNFLDPLLKEQLWKGPRTNSYFVEEKSSMYMPQVFYLSFVKTQKIMTIERSDWVVDLGSGRGADLGRFYVASTRHLICVDKDKVALAELVKRKHDIIESIIRKRQGKGKVTFHATTGTQVIVVPADITDRRYVRETLGHYLPAEGANVVICNLAVHYFLKNRESMASFAMLARDLLRPGGKLMLMFLDGAKIFDKLKDVKYGDTYDIHAEGGALKNSLRKKYNESTLMPAGQVVEVLLPFSSKQYYPEYLVNIKALSAELTRRGFKVGEAKPAEAHLGDYETHKPRNFEQLDIDDLEWIKLFVTLEAEKQ